MTPEGEGVRLQKVLARAGVASRRGSEELIAAGQVTVDGELVAELGTRVDPDTSVIHVDGVRVAVRADLVYLALNKPAGVHTTMTDERGRSCVGDYVRASDAGATSGIFHVGRLDADTEGLLLLTNDGELGHRLMHPSYEVPKTYVAEVAGSVSRGLGSRLRAGVELPDGVVTVDAFRIKDTHRGEDGEYRSLVELVLHEGRKHVVRRLLAAVEHPVRRLVRTAMGGVRLGSTKPGDVRQLTQAEVGSLYHAVGM